MMLPRPRVQCSHECGATLGDIRFSDWFRACGILLLCALASCGGNSRAPIEDRAPMSRPAAPVQVLQSSSNYRVQGGDTLYSIAFRYGLDFRKLAAANNIPAPYTIFPGQTIGLREAAHSTPVTLPTSTPGTAAGSATGGSQAVVKPAPLPRPVAVSKPVVKTQTAPAPVAAKPAAAAKDFAGGKVDTWRWPTTGRVIREYSGSVHKGIDIAGSRGDPVLAVAAGKVVYAGTGIVGFGELLIVKHNEIYLSAYGHNQRLLVSEGQTVRAGDKIALKGSSGTDIVKLHFEIRKAGKPIDPQRLLPRR